MVNELNMTLKKLILFSVLTVLGGVGVVYALSYVVQTNVSSNSIQTFPMMPTAKGVNDGLELTMTLEKTEYGLGEPINITLTITNISNQTINFTYVQPTFDFRVYNDTNNALYQWSDFQAFPQIAMLIPLNAGESLSENYVWGQTCNRTFVSEGVPVSTGTYYIVGIQPWSKLQTTPIQVTIVKP